MHPVKRTVNILRHDVRSIWDPDQAPLLKFSSHVDVVIIGGGIMGSSIAHYLKQRTGRNAFSVMVIDKDPTVKLQNLKSVMANLLYTFLDLTKFCLEYFSIPDQLQL